MVNRGSGVSVGKSIGYLIDMVRVWLANVNLEHVARRDRVARATLAEAMAGDRVTTPITISES